MILYDYLQTFWGTEESKNVKDLRHKTHFYSLWNHDTSLSCYIMISHDHDLAGGTHLWPPSPGSANPSRGGHHVGSHEMDDSWCVHAVLFPPKLRQLALYKPQLIDFWSFHVISTVNRLKIRKTSSRHHDRWPHVAPCLWWVNSSNFGQVKLLSHLQHPNVLCLHELFLGGPNFKEGQMDLGTRKRYVDNSDREG